VKLACNCINRVLGAEGDGTSIFFQPDVRGSTCCRNNLVSYALDCCQQIVPFVLAGLGHVEKEARVLVVNQFIAHLGRKPSLDQLKALARLDRAVHSGRRWVKC
jgi:hypothetical protein